MKEEEKFNFVDFGLKGDFRFMLYSREDEKLFRLGLMPLNPKKSLKTNDECLTYMVLTEEVNSFFYRNLRIIIEESQKLCDEVGLEGKEKETRYYIDKVISKLFFSYLKENEIEVLCKAEREKSENYPSRFLVAQA